MTYVGTVGNDAWHDTDEAYGVLGFDDDAPYAGGSYDVLHTVQGIDTTGGAGPDTLIGGEGDDTLDGGDGNDLLNGSYGANTLLGGAGDDRIYSEGIDYVDAGNGDDFVWADGLFGALHGGTGDDTLMLTASFAGDAGIVVIDGFEQFDDTFYNEGEGRGTLWGSSGDDTLDLGGVSGLHSGYHTNEWGDFFGNLFWILPGDGDDDITGSFIFDVIRGEGGDDTLNGAGGDDVVSGGSGTNVLSGGEGDDTVTGGGIGDTLFGDAGDDYISLDGALASTTIHGGSGSDELYLAASFSGLGNRLMVDGVEKLFAGAPGLSGSDGDDSLDLAGVTGLINSRITVHGREGDDNVVDDSRAAGNFIHGDDGNDTLFGNGGDDILSGGDGDDTLNGGDGFDVAGYYTADDGVAVSLSVTSAQSTLYAGWDLLIDIEGLSGTRYADTLTGAAGANRLTGDDGNDVLRGLGGDDTLDGGRGDDVVSGGSGNDTARFGDVSYYGVTVSLSVATVQDTGNGLDRLIGIENLEGSRNADRLAGDAGANRLDGGDGDDILTGGAGDDNLVGGAGVDTAAYVEATAGVAVDLRTTTAQDTGGAGIDTLSGIEAIRGSAFDDVLRGDVKANRIDAAQGNDMVLGYGGDDTLVGGTGGDKLAGGSGADAILGGGGGDVLIGNAGRDALTGGLGADRFVYAEISDSTPAIAGQDLIRDFSHAEGDRIDLSAIGGLTFGDGGAFTGRAGELIVSGSAGHWLVKGDVDGNGTADFAIQVASATLLVAADFIL